MSEVIVVDFGPDRFVSSVVFRNGCRQIFWTPGDREIRRAQFLRWLEEGCLVVVDRGLFDHEPQRYRLIDAHR